ncbi:hypothetical protein [Acidicapsa acidisoli]|nr:hypothetical protein [Acidicapsa acidisoli]
MKILPNESGCLVIIGVSSEQVNVEGHAKTLRQPISPNWVP